MARLIHVVMGVALLAAPGCDHKRKAPPRETLGRATTSVCSSSPGLPPAPLPPAGTPVPAADDSLLLLAEGRGLVTLSDAGFSPPIASKNGFIARDGDTVWVAGRRGVDRVRGGAAEEILTEGEVGNVAGVAVGPDHTVWVVESDQVRRFDGSAWTVEDNEKVGAGSIDYFDDIVVDDGGRVWVSTDWNTFVRGSDGWHEYQPCREPGATVTGAIARAPDGGVVLASPNAVFRVSANQIVRTQFRDGGSQHADSVALAPDGTMWVITGDTAHEIKPDGAVRHLDKAYFGLDWLGSVAVDGRGRAWIAGSGLAIVDGATTTLWRHATVAELGAGVYDMILSGGGPARLPAAAAAPLTTSVTGRVTAGGAPAAGVKVILCGSPSMSFRGNPCDGQQPRKAVTGADGVWKMDGVMMGSYGLGYFKGGWTITASDEVIAAEPGKPVDVGGIRYE